MKADVVVIGGGHNGLAAAALLAKARPEAARARARATCWAAPPSPRSSIPASRPRRSRTLPGPLRAALVEALDLREPRADASSSPSRGVFAPLAGRPRARASGATRRARPPRSARFSAAGRRALSRVPPRRSARIAALLARLLALTPPDVDRPAARRRCSRSPASAWAFRGLGREDGQRLLRWGPMAVADFAASGSRRELLRAVVCARGIFGDVRRARGRRAPPPTCCSRPRPRAATARAPRCYVKGGLGALTEALAGAARAAAAPRSAPGAEVERITAQGRPRRRAWCWRAARRSRRARWSPAPTRSRRSCACSTRRCSTPTTCGASATTARQGMASKVNLALSGAARVHGRAAGRRELLRGRIHIGADVDDLERAFDDAKYGGISRRPYLDVTIPSLADPSLAPAGPARDVRLRAVHALRAARGRLARRGATSWATSCSRTLEEYAPGHRASWSWHRQVLTPLDLEETYGLTGGHPVPRRAVARPALPGPAAPGLGALPRARARACTCAARAPTRAAASPAARAPTPPARS